MEFTFTNHDNDYTFQRCIGLIVQYYWTFGYRKQVYYRKTSSSIADFFLLNVYKSCLAGFAGN